MAVKYDSLAMLYHLSMWMYGQLGHPESQESNAHTRLDETWQGKLLVCRKKTRSLLEGWCFPLKLSKEGDSDGISSDAVDCCCVDPSALHFVSPSDFCQTVFLVLPLLPDL